MNSYATLAHLRRYLGLSDTQTGDDDLLLVFLRAASRLIEGFTGRHFYPLRQAHTYQTPDPVALLLGGDLLALHTLTNGDGSVISPSAYTLCPLDEPVKFGVLLDPAQAVFTGSVITVDGTWGFHPAWPDVWAASGDSVQDDPLSAGATSLTVNDADGPDASGLWARFAVGQLIQIEDEYLHVLAVNPTTNVLTVARGVNGTTAASHTQGTGIDSYQPPDDVQQTCLRVANWLYKQKDAGFVQSSVNLRSQMVVPAALPDDVQQILAPYIRLMVA
jgi:hypothetical protein